MKKVIIPFDGNHFSMGAFSFVQSLHNMKPVLLTGVFLPQVDYARFFFFPSSFSAPTYLPLMDDSNDIESNVERFTQLCQKNAIEYRVHKDLFDSSIPELIKESRFADLLVIGSETFYRSGSSYGSDEYLKDALHHTECGVVIVPEKFNFPTEVILAYDGSASSVFAIKQFIYLFPELADLKTIVVYAGDEKHDIPDEVLIEELVARHFDDLTVTKINSHHKDDFSNWFGGHQDSILVSGSFGRSGLSDLFSRNFIIDIIKEYKTPVFIAHQ